MGRKRDVILMVPPYADEKSIGDAAENQKNLLREIVEDFTKYSGLIIAPFKTDSLREEIGKLLEIDSDFPIATIDKTYCRDDDFFKNKALIPPPGAACDGRSNALMAANCVIDYLAAAGIAEPNVVVLQGLEGSEPRIRGFIERIDEHNSTADVSRKIHLSISREMKFLGTDAARGAESYLRQGAESSSLDDSNYMSMIKEQVERRRSGVDVFFCCNDEMALGVCEVLERELRQEQPVLHEAVVVGFDGIPEARRRIKDGDHWLLNTIDVRVRQQVQLLVNSFIPALEQHRRMTDLELVEGEPVDKNVSRHLESILGWREGQRRRLQRLAEQRTTASSKSGTADRSVGVA